MIACSHADYIVASSNDIPERWMRAAERGWSKGDSEGECLS
jgi:hypothetical protein